MTDLRPYTISGVVDTETGALVGTPITRPGHEDYTGFDSVRPLRRTEQFRWVHVWARDPTTAAATDALTADLRPGGDLGQPVARALTGDAGLKPFTVAAVVRSRTGQPIAGPVAIPGHHNLEQAGYAGRRTRSSTTRVWARDRADAIRQVFGHEPAQTAPPSAVVRPVQPAGDDLEPSVEQEWHRLADRSAAERIKLVADDVWRRWYRPTYHSAYTAAASQIAAAATDAAVANPTAWTTLHQLAAAAGQAISAQHPEALLVPPADHRTLAAAESAAAAPNSAAWQSVAAMAWTGSRAAATIAGTEHACADVLAGWRRRGGLATAEGTAVDGQPARAWIGDLLATLNRDAATDTTSALAPVRTAAQLAREDQAPGAAPTTPAVVSNRARSAAVPTPSPTPTRRTR